MRVVREKNCQKIVKKRKRKQEKGLLLLRRQDSKQEHFSTAFRRSKGRLESKCDRDWFERKRGHGWSRWSVVSGLQQSETITSLRRDFRNLFRRKLQRTQFPWMFSLPKRINLL